jgi:hypothetical protein
MPDSTSGGGSNRTAMPSSGSAATGTHTPVALCRQTIYIADEENRCKTCEKEYPAHIGHLHTCRGIASGRTAITLPLFI